MPHDILLPVAHMNQGEYEQVSNVFIFSPEQNNKNRNFKTTTLVVKSEARYEAL